MFENNNLIRLKELQRIRKNKIKKEIKNKNILFSIDNDYIDILLLSFDDCDERKIIPNYLKIKLNSLGKMQDNNFITLNNEELLFLYLVTNYYRYSFTETEKKLTTLLSRSDKGLKAAVYVKKYNVANNIKINLEEQEKTKKGSNFQTKSKNIDAAYIADAQNKYFNAWLLYTQRYQKKYLPLEFNNPDNNRYSYMMFLKSNMPHLFGLPGHKEYLTIPIVKKFSLAKQNSHFFVINDFLNIINNYRQKIINYEMHNSKKFNWERLRSKCVIFSKFGLFDVGNICVFKYKKSSKICLLKKCIDSKEKEYILLELVKGDGKNFFVPKSIRLETKESIKAEKTYLGLASNFRREFPDNIVDSIENNSNILFDIENYVRLNQEKLYESAILICETSTIFDSIILKDVDLDYLFASFDYSIDERSICTKANNRILSKD